MRRFNIPFLRSIFTVLVPTFAIAGVAQAGTLLATGTAFQPDIQVSCAALNVGRTPVLINSMKLFDAATGAELVGRGSALLSPGGSIPLQWASAANFPFCVIDVATASGAKNIRGTMYAVGTPSGTEILDAR